MIYTYSRREKIEGKEHIPRPKIIRRFRYIALYPNHQNPNLRSPGPWIDCVVIEEL